MNERDQLDHTHPSPRSERTRWSSCLCGCAPGDVREQGTASAACHPQISSQFGRPQSRCNGLPRKEQAHQVTMRPLLRLNAFVVQYEAGVLRNQSW
jgi:hypothetical protein